MEEWRLWFRIAFLLWIVLLLPVGVYFRVRSSTDERLDRRQEGWFLLIGIRLLGLATLMLVGAWLVVPSYMDWSHVPLPNLVRILGLPIALASLLLKTWTFSSIGRNITDTVVTRRDHQLITSGPYAWVRHPFYTSFAIDILGVGLLISSWSIWIGLSSVLALLITRTQREEQFLIARFGTDYEQYRQRVGAYVPKWNRPHIDN